MTTVDLRAVRAVAKLMEPLEAVVQPLFFGLENIPKRDHGPTLYVGNHTLYGIIDAPFLFTKLWRERGVVLRSLGDHVHFKVPVWREFLGAMGSVDGTRDNCAALFRAGESVLVFPGGAREVAKRRGERYKLVWQSRLGFARMAIEHGATIVPFSAVGVEDAWDVVFDADDLLRSPARHAITALNLRRDLLIPLALGLGPTPLPRPERLYFDICPPIDVSPWAGRHNDPDACQALKDLTQKSIEAGISRLQSFQATDPNRPFRKRLATALRLHGDRHRGVTQR